MNIDLNKLILADLPYALWVKDLNGQYIYANRFFSSYFNLKHEDILSRTDSDLFNNDISSFLSLADKVTLESKQEQVLIKCFSEKQLKFNFKLLTYENDIIGVLGTFIEITEKLNSEIQLKNQQLLLRTIFNTIPDVISYKNLNNTFLGCNKSFAKFYKFKSTKDVIGKTDFDIHENKKLAKKLIEYDQDVVKHRIKKVNHITLTSSDGKEVYFENIKAPIITNNNKVIGTVEISRDITYRKDLETHLFKLNYKDSLTSLYNRTYFSKLKEKIFKLDSLPLSIIMGDINGLKLINDSFGHLEGDKLILSIANIIKSCCSKEDLIFRWGGDEIIVLLPNTPPHIAQNIVNNIYLKCNETSNFNIPLSTSLGTSTIESLDTTIEDALKDAEAKVYRHKLLQTESYRSSLLDTLQRSLLEKSEETEQHTERLQKYAIKIGEYLKLQSSDIDDLILLCNLHDIGKIGIPENILLKPSELTTNEFKIMKLHCEKGYRITRRIPELYHISKAILTHHEKWDGTGYPLHLSGNDIPLISRIVCVVDAFDAMTNDRAYHKAISIQAAIKEIQLNSGTQFDPTIVNAFITVMKKEVN